MNYAKLRVRLLADKQVLDWTNAAPARASVPRLKLDGLVIDDRDAQQQSEWVESSSVPNQVGPGYLHDNNARKGEMNVIFAPTITTAGQYELVLISTPNPNRASNVPVTVQVLGQSRVVRVNQRTGNGLASLGKFQLPAGRECSVTVSNAGTDGFVVVDGLQLRPVQ